MNLQELDIQLQGDGWSRIDRRSWSRGEQLLSLTYGRPCDPWELKTLTGTSPITREYFEDSTEALAATRAPKMADVIVWGTFDDPQDPEHDHTWYDAKIPADSLGDFDTESEYIAEYLAEHHADQGGVDGIGWGSPVIVVEDPLGRFKRGCSTRSEFNGEDDPSHPRHNPATDYHSNCEHGL